MAYTATQSPMEVENKADRLESFYSPPLQDSFGEAFVDHTVHFAEASWFFGDSDNSSGPGNFPNPDTLLFTPTASPSHKPRFLSGASSAPSSPTDCLSFPDPLSQASQDGFQIKQKFEAPGPDWTAGGQSQASLSDINGTSSPFSGSPQPPVLLPLQDPPFSSISDSDLLKIEGISLQTTPRILPHSTPSSPTVTRQSGEAFYIFAPDIGVGSASEFSEQATSEFSNAKAPRRRLAVPRPSFRTENTDDLSQDSRKPATEFSFVRGSVGNPFGNPNAAPMPPPRELKTVQRQATPSPQMGIMSNGMGYLGAVDGLPKTPLPLMPSLSDGFTGKVPKLSPSLPSVEKQEWLWDAQGGLLDNKPFTASKAAVHSAKINLAKPAESSEHPGYEDYSNNPTSNCLMPALTMYPSTPRPHSQTTGIPNVYYFSPTMSQSTSLPSTPAQPPAGTPFINPQQWTPMSSPLRKAHTTQRVSTSPRPARGRLQVGEPGATRSTSTASDNSVRKRRSPSRRESRKPLSPDEGGFVNFTTQDSQALIRGVAPSGSSKTKAKREREEQERRKRLEAAAVKAVEAAGGDVQLLADASLLDA